MSRYLISILTGLLVAQVAGAYVASSTNYRLQSDTINFGGGLSTSSSYTLESTMGEIGSGRSTTTPVNLNAGFQEMQEVYLAMSAPTQVSIGSIDKSDLTPQTTGTGTWTINTDNPAGYSLLIRSTTNPALASSLDSFANYPGVTFGWSVGAAQSYFGFTPEGADIATTFRDNGSSCGAGASDAANSCWSGITTSNVTVAESTGRTPVSGTNTVLKFRAEAGTTRVQTQQPGGYVASILVTAIAQ